MVAVNAVIRVNIDASAANAGLASMAAQMGRFNKGMIACLLNKSPSPRDS